MIVVLAAMGMDSPVAVHGVRADAGTVALRELGDEQFAGALHFRSALQACAQGLRHRRPGVDEIDVDAARAIMSRCLHLRDVTVLACPADAPLVHLADAGGRFLAKKLGKRPAAPLAPPPPRTR